MSGSRGWNGIIDALEGGGVRPRDRRRGSPRGRACGSTRARRRRPATACIRWTPTPRTTCAARGSRSAQFPRTILFDPLMNFPAGGVAIWPPLFDLALAAARAARRTARARRPSAVERGAAWVPVALAAGPIVLAGLLGAGGSTARAGAASRPRSFSRSARGTSSGRSTRTPTSTPPNRSAACSRSGSSSAAARSRTRPATPRARPPPARALAARGPGLAGSDLLGRDLRARARLRGRARAPLDAARRRLDLGLPAAVTAAATAAWLGWLSPPLTYVSFGFFQPLFLAALCGGTAALGLACARRRTAPRRAASSPRHARRGGARGRRDAALRRGTSSAGLVQRSRLRRRERRTRSPATAGYVSYPKDWLKGIFETRPLLADGPGLALAAALARLLPRPAGGRSPGSRAPAAASGPGVHVALAIWGGRDALPRALAAPERLLRRAARGARRCSRPSRVARRAALPRRALAAALGIALALPMAPGLASELRHRVRAGLGPLRDARPDARGAAARDRRLRPGPARAAALSRRRSRGRPPVLAPWSLGHLILYEAELPVVANNFGYGFLDSIRFFLADSEEEALAIARRHRARWVVATDLAPRMNDYASYLGRPPCSPSARAPRRRRPTSRRCSRASTTSAAAARELPGVSIPPLVALPAALPLAERDPPRRPLGSALERVRGQRGVGGPQPPPHAVRRGALLFGRRGLERDRAELPRSSSRPEKAPNTPARQSRPKNGGSGGRSISAASGAMPISAASARAGRVGAARAGRPPDGEDRQRGRARAATARDRLRAACRGSARPSRARETRAIPWPRARACRAESATKRRGRARVDRDRERRRPPRRARARAASRAPSAIGSAAKNSAGQQVPAAEAPASVPVRDSRQSETKRAPLAATTNHQSARARPLFHQRTKPDGRPQRGTAKRAGRRAPDAGGRPARRAGSAAPKPKSAAAARARHTPGSASCAEDRIHGEPKQTAS